MADTSITPSRVAIERSRSYRSRSLVDLVGLIVRDADPSALHEFHDHRSVFRCPDEEAMLFAEFLDHLRGSSAVWRWSGRNSIVVEAAYDLTLDKFTNLPEDAATEDAPDENQGSGRGRNGPDARNYFGAFLEYANRVVPQPVGDLEAELLCARHLQDFVLRHYRFSCLECSRRSRPLLRRYSWNVDGHAVSLWMPLSMGAAHCGTWLRDNIGQPDLSRPNERQRIQQIIDDRLGHPRLVRFSELGLCDGRSIPAPPVDITAVASGLNTNSLAETVAQEKAECIEAQRPSIRALGKENLASMIRRIFDELADGTYADGRVAREFNLSKATFSRFAGSRWQRSAGKQNSPRMPDLWRNTAQVLGAFPPFRRAARDFTQAGSQGTRFGPDRSSSDEPQSGGEEL